MRPLSILILMLAGIASEAHAQPANALGTWVDTDSTFYAPTDSTPGYHVLYARVTLSDSLYTYMTIGSSVDDPEGSGKINAYELPGPARWDGHRLTTFVEGFGEQVQMVEVRGDSLWFTSEDGADRAGPFRRQLEVPPLPDALVGVWTGGAIVDNAGVPAFVTVQIRADGTLVASDHESPAPLELHGRFLLMAKSRPDTLYPGEIDMRWYDVIPYSFHGDFLTLELGGQPVTFQRARDR